MDSITFPTTNGADLRMERENAGVSQGQVAKHFPRHTARQRVSRMEREASVPYVDAVEYRAALQAAVAEATGQSRVA